VIASAVRSGCGCACGSTLTAAARGDRGLPEVVLRARLSRAPIRTLAAAVCALAVGAVFTGCGSSLPRTSPEEFGRLLADRKIAVIDVRTVEEYQAGHIPGALSVPVDEIDARIDQIKGLGKPIIAYCSCLAEESSLMAVASLNRLGVKGARALTGGYPAWASAGGRIVLGSSPL
jgi:rhodanese-related sulfurtransferase